MTTKTRSRHSTAPRISPPKKSDRGPTTRGRSASASVQDSFTSTLGHEERESQARADKAESQAEDQRRRTKRNEGPGRTVGYRGVSDNVPAGARGSGVPSRRSGSSLRQVNRTLRRFGGSNPRRLLIAELVAVLAIVTIADIADGNAPTASNYVAPFVVYLVLAFLTEFGDDSARLAAGMGGLVLLALVLAHSGGITKALTYVTNTAGPPSKHPTHNQKGD